MSPKPSPSLSLCLYITMLILLIAPCIQSYSCPVSNPPAVQLGNSAVVCIHIVYKNKNKNPTTNATQDGILTYAFKTTVDKFSSLRIGGIGSNFTKQGTQIHAVLQFQNNDTILSQMIIYSPFKQSGISRQIFSFVVNLDYGIITSFSKDNANCDNCDTSGNQVCNANTDNYECFDKGKYPGSEDPKFYISWIGTDVSGNHMLSHTKRLSRFTQYSIGSIYQKAKSLVT